MQRVTEEDEKEQLTDKRREPKEDFDLNSQESGKKKRRKSKKKKKHKKDEESEEENEKVTVQESKKKTSMNNDMFIIGTYNLIKMLGFGAFGEIHLSYDTSTRQLRAIKFEIASQKNPQLKHEFNILEQLNKSENGVQEGIPRVYGFDRIENKCNYMIMDFLGPSLADLFQFRNKKFSLKSVCLLAIQMLQRIEFIHEKGFIHRDIKPENFVVGLNEKSNIVHIIDFGLSKRYKDKNTGQHIPYRENRHLVGTARYASLNAHLGVEQSRRDDIESIGYVLVYFCLGRLPWQSKMEKGKQPVKIMEKKLITPPEILCKKLPMEFSYYFHYCKNLKFEDRPDYATLKYLFYDLLIQQENVNQHFPEFTFDWYQEEEKNDGKFEDDRIDSLLRGSGITPLNPKKKAMFDLENNKIVDIREDPNDMTPGQEDNDLINFKDINSNFNNHTFTNNNNNNNSSGNYNNISNPIIAKLSGKNQDLLNNNDTSNFKERTNFSFNKADFIINNLNVNKEENLIKLDDNEDLIQLKNVNNKKEKKKHDDSWSEQSSGEDTEKEQPRNDDDEIKKIIKTASDSNKNNSDSQYKLLSSSGKSTEERKKEQNLDDEIILKPNSKNNKSEKNKNKDVILNIDKNRK